MVGDVKNFILKESKGSLLFFVDFFFLSHVHMLAPIGSIASK